MPTYSKITRTTYKVSDFVSWQKNGLLVLSPSFQRRPVWTQPAKSYLIDTVIRGFPMPVIFLRDLKTDLRALEARREVIDGQQRIRTLLSFIIPGSIEDFDPAVDNFTVRKSHNAAVAGLPFSELPPDVAQKILDYEFSAHVFPADTDDREVLQIFSRMNATGVRLSGQEIRNALFFGEFKTLMYTLGAEQLPRWRGWQIFTEYNIARMEEVELTSEFALLALRGVQGKTQATISSAYESNEERFAEADEVAKRIRAVMDAIDDRLGAEMSELPFARKTLFYSLFAAFYDALYGIGSTLAPKRASKIDPAALVWIRTAGDQIAARTAPKQVLAAIDRRTTHVDSRKAIFAYLRRVK